MTHKLPKKVKSFLGNKIRKNIKEGRSRDQAVAISFSQTRKKFPRYKNELTQKDQRKFRKMM